MTVSVTKPTSATRLSDGAKIGSEADTFKLLIHELRAGFRAGEVYDNTGDTDDANTAAVVPFPFWQKQFVFLGVMVGGSVTGFAQLGATDAGVPVTMTYEDGHTLAGNIVLTSCNFVLKRNRPVVPLVFSGIGVGTWTEGYTAS